MARRSNEEIFNTLTHLSGVVMTLAVAWLVLVRGYRSTWQNAFGATFFTVGMLVMYACSTFYHWWMPGRGKRVWRIFDHISIYVMIAASYTPICIGVVGGALGWTVFGLLWGTVALGTAYKIAAIDRWPRLSLILYLLMGWCVLFIAQPVYERLSAAALAFILAEGVFYTSGTYFFAHDSRKWFHGIWHIFVLLGSVCHWAAVFIFLG